MLGKRKKPSKTLQTNKKPTNSTLFDDDSDSFSDDNIIENHLFGDDDKFLSNLSRFCSSKKIEPETNGDEEQTKTAAWFDEDDEDINVRTALDVQKRTLPSGGIHDDNNKYHNVLTNKFQSLVGTPAWADLKRQTKGDDSDDEILATVGFLTQKKSKCIAKETIDFKKLKDLNNDTRNEGPYINTVQFHRQNQLALIAGNSGVGSFVHVDGKTNDRVYSLKLQKFPIRSGKFSVAGDEAIFGTTHHRYMHVFDLESMRTRKLRLPHGVTNLKVFELSPCGRFMAVAGRFGEIHILNANSKQLIKSVKQQSDVRGLAFDMNGDKLFTHGSDGQVTVWDMRTMRVQHKWFDEGCIQGSSICMAPTNDLIATGSAEGVVNLYDVDTTFMSQSPKPRKAFLNLTTAVTHVKFNPTSEILAFSSTEKDGGVRLAHVVSQTVFKNFPGTNTQCKRVQCLDFSPRGGYLATGNHKSSVLLFKLNHYKGY